MYEAWWNQDANWHDYGANPPDRPHGGDNGEEPVNRDQHDADSLSNVQEGPEPPMEEDDADWG